MIRYWSRGTVWVPRRTQTFDGFLIMYRHSIVEVPARAVWAVRPPAS
jgi:hypothetical protein